MGINLRFWKRKSPTDKAVEKVSKLPSKSKIVALILLILVLSSAVSATSVFLYDRYFLSKVRSSLDFQLGKIKEGTVACGKFAVSYGLFYEKAAELFVNGATGCAIRYIESNRPNDMPEGCYRLYAVRVRPGESGWWGQDPDPKYYDSLKELYTQAMDARTACESIAGEVGISW